MFDEIKQFARQRPTQSGYATQYQPAMQAPSYRPPSLYPAPETPQAPYALGRNIQPRPTHGAPPGAYPPAQARPPGPYLSTPSSATEPPHSQLPPKQGHPEEQHTQAKKIKRGRPSNAEVEQRRQEYHARGETYPPPRSRKRSRPTGQSAPGVTGPSGGGRGASGGQGPSSSRPSESPQTTQTPSSSVSMPGSASGAPGAPVVPSVEESIAAPAKTSPPQRSELSFPRPGDRPFQIGPPVGTPRSFPSPGRQRQLLPPPPLSQPSTPSHAPQSTPFSQPRRTSGEGPSTSTQETQMRPTPPTGYHQRILPQPIPQTPYPTPQGPRSNEPTTRDNGRH